MGLPRSHRISRARWYSGFLPLRFSFNYRAVTLFCCAFQHSSSTSTDTFVSPNPTHISICGLGSYPFARHYLGNRCFTFSSSGYLDVSVPRVPLVILSIHITIPYISIRCVPAFGYLRINVYLQLPVAFRSLSRPSSAPDAKASTIRSY